MYVAIDFETANDSKLSACSIGAVSFDNHQLGNRFQSLIRPPDEHSHLWGSNYRIHKISRSRYMNAEKFPKVWQKLQKNLDITDKVFVCHNSGFDINVLKELFTYFKIDTKKIYYLDTLNLGKLTWSIENYKLPTLTDLLNIKLNHHDALSDALASAKITIKSLEKHKSTDFNGILKNSRFGYGVLEKNKNTSMSSSKVKSISIKDSKKMDLQNKMINAKKTNKFCKLCNTNKPISQFDIDKRTTDGYKTYCKSESHKTKILKVEKKEDFTFKLENIANKEITGYEETDLKKELSHNQEKPTKKPKKEDVQIIQNIDEELNGSKKILSEKVKQNIKKQESDDFFEIDHETNVSIAGFIISMLLLILIISN